MGLHAQCFDRFIGFFMNWHRKAGHLFIETTSGFSLIFYLLNYVPCYFLNIFKTHL